MTSPARSGAASLDRSSATDSPGRRRSSSHQQSRPRLASMPVTLWVHEPPNFSSNDVVIHPDVIARFGSGRLGLSEGELLEVRSLGSRGADKTIRGKRFVFKPIDALPDSEVRSNTLQLSLSKPIAQLYGLHNRSDVLLSKVPRDPHTISHLELYFRDQYVGRADMWRLANQLEDACVYVGQKITLAGCVRATVGRIFIKEKKVTSGYIAPHTRTIYRSESAKYNLLIQLAKEMWEFDEDGELYYEKAISGFIPELVRKWKMVPTNHVVSVVLFARVHYDASEVHMLQDADLPLQKEEGTNGRWYIDYYKTIVDLEGNCEWNKVLTDLKEEFFRFQHDILLLIRPVAGPAGAPGAEDPQADLLRRDRALLAGRLSASHEGNILEAVNLALNPADAHFVDRDLMRTGFDIVVLTAGTGHFKVSKKLLRLTTERMIDSGTGLDLVCLTKMPLHSVPLFHFESAIPDQSQTSWPNSVPARGRRARKTPSLAPSSGPPDPLYFDQRHASIHTHSFSTGVGQQGAASTNQASMDFYSIPHWVDCSFYNLQQDKPFRADRFVPRCKMHEVQMMGIMENEISDICLPYLQLGGNGLQQLGPPVGMGDARRSSMSGPTRSVNSSGAVSSAERVGTTGSLLPTQGASSSGAQHSEGAMSADLSHLPSREVKRILRERFDAETMRDLDIAPSKVRSSMVLAFTGRAPSGLTPMGSSPSRSLTRQRSGEMLGVGNPTSASPANQGPAGRVARVGRDARRGATLLEAHDEHPDDSAHERGPPSRIEGLDSESPGSTASARNSNSMNASTESPARSTYMSKTTSRPTSLRSVATFNRAIRPLEPVGKAPAWVAPSDPDQMHLEDMGPITAAQTLPPSRSASAVLSQQQATRSKSRYRLPTHWLWSSLRGAQTEQRDPASAGSVRSASRPGSLLSTEQKDVETSASASRRIAALLASSTVKGSDQDRNSSKTDADADTDVLQGDNSLSEEHAQSPIAIPSGQHGATRDGHNTTSGPPLTRTTSTGADSRREREIYEQALEQEVARTNYAQQAQVEKQTLVNPSNPQKSLSANKSSTQLMRWQHLFPRRLNRHAVKWRSMTSPACLPLTTLYLPSEVDLANQWLEYPYTMSVAADTSSFMVKHNPSTYPALAVLKEMSSQRLAQGFQFIVPVNAEGHGSSAGRSINASGGRSASASLRQPSELFQPGNLVAGNPIFLGMPNQIHRISYDRSMSAIHVKRYVRKIEHDASPMDYACCIWPRDVPCYQTVKTTFHYPDFGAYNWTYLDQIISGHAEEEKFIDGLRYWRARFVVVPTEGPAPTMRAASGEQLDDEEVRLMGIDRLADLFARAKLKTINRASGREERSYSRLRFIPTSLDPSASFNDEQFMKQMLAAVAEDDQSLQENEAKKQRNSSATSSTSRSRKKILGNMDLRSLATEMRHETERKLIHDRYWQAILYKDSFTGADFVTWLCRNFQDVKTREEASNAGSRLLREGLFEHVNRAHGFLDGHYFYRLRPEYTASRGSKWFAASSREGSDESQGLSARDSRGSSGHFSNLRTLTSERGRHHRGSSSTASIGQPVSLGRKLVKLSRTHIIDLDSQRKSDRAEVAFLHHDIAHNPANGFNCQIHWLGTTARFIEDTVQTWTRTVERYGLKLIEAPIGQIADVSSRNPFQAPAQIFLALQPPHSSLYSFMLSPFSHAEHYFEWALLRRFGFILDQEASDRFPDDVDFVYDSRPKHFTYSQFVHRSGVAFVQVLGGAEGFLWLNNRLFNSHAAASSNQSRGRQERDGPGKVGSNRENSAAGTANTPDADSVRRDFEAFCADSFALEMFYRSTIAHLSAAAGGNPPFSGSLDSQMGAKVEALAHRGSSQRAPDKTSASSSSLNIQRDANSAPRSEATFPGVQNAHSATNLEPVLEGRTSSRTRADV
ncbi:hypothetical protein IE81DRAFT_313369 [Ceraceosorus guamensis]|uniref:Vacuolar membrane-associated protein IML1 n=1 Tax=Ceraceosorus guamensis TaxID=1522189 RepID=A0A316W088_9BASI|nr:hypothetical protein IE81DRAFT_313369 [Ceraceosorus guamensis]PWN42538.1 hypothetical protein IE81DRAFT_313369 [Ceraceosorus guamensis]